MKKGKRYILTIHKSEGNNLEKRENWYRRIIPYFIGFYCAVNIGLGLYYVILSQPYFYLLSFCAPLFLLLPHIWGRIFTLRPVYEFHFLIYFFCFLLYTVGLVMQGYSYIPFYDKFAHTLSGVFFTLLGVIFFYLLKPKKTIETSDFPLLSVFCLSFSIAIAGVWEIGEYLVGMLFPFWDPQQVSVSGVNDTMQDIIVCVFGSFLFYFGLLSAFRKGKPNFLLTGFDTFFHKNIAKDFPSMSKSGYNGLQ